MQKLKLSRSIIKEVFNSGISINIDNSHKYNRFKNNKSISKNIPLSIIVIPMKVRKEVRGALYMTKPATLASYTNEQRLILEEILFFVTSYLENISFFPLTPKIKTKIEIPEKVKKIMQNYGFIGVSDSYWDIVNAIMNFSQSDIHVLITGENGVGKEVVANLIHILSPRSKYMFFKYSTICLLAVPSP